jgi:hypothetical protein
MDLSQVKLIVSDMDGTLLNSEEEVSERFFQQFEQLDQLGIHFVAASGRQFDSIAEKLAPIKDRITIVGENGAVAKYKNETLMLKSMDAKSIQNLLPELRNIDNAFIILCGEHSAFIETKNSDFIETFQEYYRSYKIVDDLMEIAQTTPVLKIAMYHPTSAEEQVYPKVKHLEESFLLKVSGNHWLDISNYGSNKGNALKVIQQERNISKEETLVFGDYMNDLEMLQQAKFSYAMKNAHSEVKKNAQFETDSNDDFGVENVLEEVIRIKKETF